MKDGEQRVGRIAIFGKARELWPVASLLGKILPSEIELVVVEVPDTGRPVPLTIRLDDPLFSRLGITAADFQGTDSAIFALGTELHDWQGEGSRFLQTGSGPLPDIEQIAIHQIMLRAAQTYDQPDRLAYLYQPFRLPARVAAAGKFAFQSSDPASPLSMLRPTVQIESGQYAVLLKTRCASDRIEIVGARPKAVQLASDRERVGGIELDNGRIIEADLFIDSSGVLNDLGGLKEPSDWYALSDGMPFDRQISAQRSAMPSASKPPAIAQAVAGGLLMTTALRKTSMAQLVYASGALSSEAAQALLETDVEATVFAPGYVQQPWVGNLVRLGRASAWFGPFLCADTTMLHRQAVILEALVPTGLDMTVEAREFNRRHLIVAEQVRDFILLPLVLNGRTDAPWRGIGNLPESLAIRLEQFRSRGRLVTFESELFDEQSWIDLMIGFGIVPDRCDPMARSLDMGLLARRLKKLTQAFDRALATIAEQQPEAGAFLA